MATIEQGIEAIIVSASGCGVHIKEYGYLLREDKHYAAKAAKISAMTKDISEFVSEFDLEKLKLNVFKKYRISKSLYITAWAKIGWRDRKSIASGRIYF